MTSRRLAHLIIFRQTLFAVRFLHRSTAKDWLWFLPCHQFLFTYNVTGYMELSRPIQLLKWYTAPNTTALTPTVTVSPGGEVRPQQLLLAFR